MKTMTTCTYWKQFLVLTIAVIFFTSTFAQTNAIKEENLLAGSPASEWDLPNGSAGSLTLQGFATDMSVNHGEQIDFKINTATVFDYNIRIYRLGYYGGLGARMVADLGTVTGTVQPVPISDAATGNVDCGNWSVSASWLVPGAAVSGVYIAKLTRVDNPSIASHIVFIVRADESNSDLFFQTSDATWQAYNGYGGNSLYSGTAPFPGGRAVKVSYNRPFLTRGGGGGGGIAQDWLFTGEYPMIKFLERNGYDVTYTTNIDAARRGNLIQNHKIFLSVGHDEYWSAEQRNNVEAARNAGVNLCFFSGNEVYWKTRWENSIDGNGTPYRTLVCYKEGTLGEFACGEDCSDPSNEWTGLWRDGCNNPSEGGCLPENRLTAQISWTLVVTELKVPAAFKNLRLWRHTDITSLAPEAEATLGNGVIGYEASYEQFPESNPPGRITMSRTVFSDNKVHKLALYRHNGNALVFGAGTAQWSWGLDDYHDLGDGVTSDIRIQQATLNLFADMDNVQPTSIMAGLTQATASTDVTAPQAVITSPLEGANVLHNTVVTITGTASDAGGVVAGIEISLDGGATWVAASGTTTWSYSWTPVTPGSYVIKVRGIDDSGNIGVEGTAPSSNAINVNVLDNLAITATSPLDNAIGVSVNASITTTFNTNINPATVTNTTVELKDASNNVISAILNTVDNVVTLTPSAALSFSTVYTMLIKGGPSGIASTASTQLQQDSTWSFTTADPITHGPNDGPGGPILVISTTSNPFSRYAVEILRAEGLNHYAAEDITNVTPTLLNNYDVVVLGEMPVNASQVTMFTDWVNAGGTLIAFRPSDLLASLMGISTASGTLTNQYLLINTASGPGTGIVNQTIQFHGEANLHTLSGATSLATLYSNATTATGNPAVTSINVGINGGKAIAFTYDLAKSIIYTRQGNPAWAGLERDGLGPIRSNDLFFGNAAWDPQPEWLDFNKVAIPQADEQQRLLANIIIKSNLHRKPLPRFWYLPKGLKAAIVMTGDDHAFNGTAGRFNQYLTMGPNSPQDVADWNAVRGTSYIYPGSSITNTQAMAYEAQGFEIALHPTTNCADFTFSSLQNTFTVQLAQLAAQLPGISVPVTNRTHCLLWSDWASMPKVEVEKGIRLDVGYYYWPEFWMQNTPGMFTGSGMPMRYADLDGSIIDCYQAATQMTDETNMNYTAFCNTILDRALGAEGYYGVFTANMHTDQDLSEGSDAIIASAQARQVPVVSAKQMLTWLDGRNGSSFGSISWNVDELSFTINALSAARNIKAMLPKLSDGGGELISITRNGSPVTFAFQTIKGIEYAFFDAVSGNYVASYGEAPTGTLNGTVVLQGRSAAPNAQWIIPVTVELYQNGNPTPVATFNTTTDANGQFSITGVPIGTYSITAKNGHTLRNVVTGQAIIAGINEVNFGTLIEGDVSDNNVITALDLGSLLSSYNKASGDAGFIANADLNNDGLVTAIDLGLLLSNYNTIGQNP